MTRVSLGERLMLIFVMHSFPQGNYQWAAWQPSPGPDPCAFSPSFAFLSLCAGLYRQGQGPSSEVQSWLLKRCNSRMKHAGTQRRITENCAKTLAHEALRSMQGQSLHAQRWWSCSSTIPPWWAWRWTWQCAHLFSLKHLWNPKKVPSLTNFCLFADKLQQITF